MSTFFYREVPEYRLSGFCAVRDCFDNLKNVLQVAEIINTCSYCTNGVYEDNFNIAVLSEDYCRVIIKKNDGYFSMALPFQIVENGTNVNFICNHTLEEVSGKYISIMRNALSSSQNTYFSHEDIILSLTENFNLEVFEAVKYYDAFAALISDDHGYFRFDDDVNNANGDIHPRYHFDIFFKNSTSIKVGYDKFAGLDCLYALFDHSKSKHYMGR
jgi:hypothetical protein